ncbi:DUF1707 SHOCT-like domain-containing protein [Streptomyces hoynatensis]|uniref:DUF1707 domain-containing protein n=1 Tax=Streptomyces hoynatensis TaxID=1141874 RepID=A0A3A9ZEA4_9ACTN|nr:DUF1707 domain-containing protein [Streptomyces hoynatensis]RKN46688.1 DUF1707 domain-containing protein [Streptomyces hoynatensis]
MPDDAPPPNLPAPRPGNPQLRVSDREREQVVEFLQVAAGDGRLTLAELDERVGAALAARTVSDLAALTADLPLEEMPPGAREVIRIDQRFGESERTGRWLVPRRMEVALMFSELKLDFTEAVLTHRVLDIDVNLRLGGHLTLVTAPGIVVNADGISHSRGEIKLPPAPGPETPVRLSILLTGRSTGGDIVARPPRRAPWQRLRRKPRPGDASP